MPVRPGRKFFQLGEAKTCNPGSLLGTSYPDCPAPTIAAAREDIYTDEGYANVFAVHNVLSASECAALVAAGEEFGFEDLKREYPSSYRANDRVLLHDPVTPTLIAIVKPATQASAHALIVALAGDPNANSTRRWPRSCGADCCRTSARATSWASNPLGSVTTAYGCQQDSMNASK